MSSSAITATVWSRTADLGSGACQVRTGRRKLAGMFLDIMAWDKLLLFTGGELLFSLAPGPTVVMISAYGFRGGFRDALAAICGTQTGNSIWYVLCALGLGAVVTASPLAFAVLRYLGAVYLIWLGGTALWQSRKPL